jgi:hypothetical protein
MEVELTYLLVQRHAGHQVIDVTVHVGLGGAATDDHCERGKEEESLHIRAFFQK